MSQRQARQAPADGARAAPSAAPAAGDDDLLLRFAQQMRTPLIIEPRRPVMSAGSVARHLVTLACWTVWVHFLMPLLTLLAWMTGWRRFSTQLLAPEGLDLLRHYVPVYLTVLVLICGSLIVWALFNWWRFSNRQRRKASISLTNERLAADLGLPTEDLRRWQTARRLVVQHDSQGHPCGVDEFGSEPSVLP